MFRVNAVKMKAGVVGQVLTPSGDIVWESQPFTEEDHVRVFDEDGSHYIKDADTLAREAAEDRIKEALAEMFVDVRPIAR